MRWIVEHDQDGDEHGKDRAHEPHKHGVLDGCLHPLFGLGVATALVALIGGSWYLVTQL